MQKGHCTTNILSHTAQSVREVGGVLSIHLKRCNLIMERHSIEIRQTHTWQMDLSLHSNMGYRCVFEGWVHSTKSRYTDLRHRRVITVPWLYSFTTAEYIWSILCMTVYQVMELDVNIISAFDKILELLEHTKIECGNTRHYIADVGFHSFIEKECERLGVTLGSYGVDVVPAVTTKLLHVEQEYRKYGFVKTLYFDKMGSLINGTDQVDVFVLMEASTSSQLSRQRVAFLCEETLTHEELPLPVLPTIEREPSPFMLDDTLELPLIHDHTQTFTCPSCCFNPCACDMDWNQYHSCLQSPIPARTILSSLIHVPDHNRHIR